MKDVILLELANRWEIEAISPSVVDGNPEAKIPNAIAQGHREAKRECADTLRVLIGMIGDPK